MIGIGLEAPEAMILTEDQAGQYLQAYTLAMWGPQARHQWYPPSGYRKGQFLWHAQPQNRTGSSNTLSTSAHHLEQILREVPEVPILLWWDRAPGTLGSLYRRYFWLILDWKSCTFRWPLQISISRSLCGRLGVKR